jgi:phospholipid/cholesterol/gamma-HCH transport system substrate-binding protein
VTDRRPGLKFLIFALVCAISGTWIIGQTGNYTLGLIGRTSTFSAELTDATGLMAGDDVRVAGVAKGRVKRVGIERGVAVAEFTLHRDVTPTDTWEVGLRWRNVIGQRYLYLYPVGGGQPLEPDDRIPVAQSRPQADIGEFFNRLNPLLAAIDPEQQNIVLTALNEALVGREERVQELVAALGSLTGTLADRDDEIRSVITNASALLDSYARREAELQQFLADLADVSTTVARRNDELIGAVSDIGEMQEEFAGMLARNDADIRGSLAHLETITSTVGEHIDEYERALETTRHGFATYMLISRWGQWFNVRFVASQTQTSDGRVLGCTVEDGSECELPNAGGPGGDGTRASFAPARHDAALVARTTLPGGAR